MFKGLKVALATGTAIGLCLAVPAKADVPTVAVDIAPLHGLVARVMGDLGEPSLILPQGASPHGYALRPTDARALNNSDLIFWISEDLTPWLGRAVATMPEERITAPMMSRDGTVLLDMRETAIFTGDAEGDGHDNHGHEEHAEAGHDDHGHEEHAEAGHDDHGHEEHAEAGHDDHGHEEHAEAGHDDHGHEDHAEAGHDDHGDEEHAEAGHDDHGHGHDHHHHAGGVDPHGWMDPENAKVWLAAIAEDLAQADPENAETYRANAVAGQAEVDAAAVTAAEQLGPVTDMRYVVFHDAYHYFEDRFGLAPIGAISLSDATTPGPAHLSALRAEIAEEDITCIFAEPQFSSSLVRTVAEGSGAQAAVLDPLGSTISPGPEFYPLFLTSMSNSIAGCADAS